MALVIKKATLDDVATRLILAIAFLNLNGLASMVIGVGQIFTPFLAAASLYLLMRSPHVLWRGPASWYVGGVLAYISIGLTAALLSGQVDGSMKIVFDYMASILLVGAVVVGFVSAQRRGGQSSLIRFMIVVLALTCILIILSPLLYPYYSYVPASFEQRSSGAFANPNEAGVVAVIFLSVLLSAQNVKLKWKVLLGALAVLAALSTYSKAAMIGLFVILMLGLLTATRGWIKVGIGFAFVASIALFFSGSIHLGAPTFLTDHLSPQRARRVLQAFAILQGEFGTETSTNRSDLWAYGLLRISESPFIGSGLGSFHSLVGGVYSEAGWLGIHNAFLMIVGEAGIFALIPFLLFFASAFLAKSSRDSIAAKLLLSSVVICMITTHGALELRFISVTIGVAVALLINNRADRADHV